MSFSLEIDFEVGHAVADGGGVGAFASCFLSELIETGVEGILHFFFVVE